MPGPCFRLSTLDGELLALTMSTHPTPMFTLTDSASRPEIAALNRAGPLEMQTHQECPPRRISPLEYALTENRACKSFRIRTYNFIALKAPWNEHLQKRGGRGVASRYWRAHQLGAMNVHCSARGLVSSTPFDRASANRCCIAASSAPNGSTVRRCHARIFDQKLCTV